MKYQNKVVRSGLCLAGLAALQVMAQSVMHASNYDPRGKVYVNEVYKASTVDQFGHATGDPNQLRVRLVGPENITRGTRGKFYLDLEPVIDPAILAGNPGYYKEILDFYILAGSSEGFIQLTGSPVYSVAHRNQMPMTRVQEMTDSERQFYVYFGNALPVVIGAVPGLGQTLKFTQNMSELMDWKDLDDVDWKNMWIVNSQVDFYPIIPPRHVKEMRFNAIYSIEIPFEALQPDGMFGFYIAYLTTSDIEDQNNKSVFSEIELSVRENENAVPKRNPVLIQAPYSCEGTIGIDSQNSIKYSIDLRDESDKNILGIQCDPLCTDPNSYAHLQNINLALEFGKPSPVVSDMPVFFDYSRNVSPFRTLRDKYTDDQIVNWIQLGISCIMTFIMPVIMPGVSPAFTIANGTIDLLEAREKALQSVSFSDMMENLWAHQRMVNFYQIPPMPNECDNNDGPHGFRVEIPITYFNSRPAPFHLYFEGILHSEKKQEYSSPITSAHFKYDNDQFSYVIPIDLKMITGQIQPPVRSQVPAGTGNDVVLGFILDSSGSMQTNDPNNIRISAVQQIVDQLSGSEKVFVVDFDEDAVWLNPSEWSNWDRNLLKARLNRIDSRGGTNIGKGLQKLREALEAAGQQNARGAVFLLTDGKGSYSNEADWFQARHLPVYTVSYKDYASSALLSEIADATGGLYLKADNEGEIVASFTQILNEILGSNKIVRHTRTIHQDEVVPFEFYIDQNTKIVYFSASWTGSRVSLRLTSPDGSVYNQQSGGSWSVGRNYSLFKLVRPQGGKWRAEIRGEEIPPGGEPVSFEVSGDTPNQIDIVQHAASSGRIEFGLISRTGSIRMQNIRPLIRVTTPDKRVIDISSRYADSRFSYQPVSGNGDYKFEIAFNAQDPSGNTIQRFFTRTVLVGNYKPAYIGAVTRVMGSFIYTDLGKQRGNRPGIQCTIFDARMGQIRKGRGYVLNVQDNTGVVQLQQQFGQQPIIPNDIVHLDIVQWKNDGP
ncbi:VWA domain-containing protein [bacterium]|nr:VWA domain-containing protein [bacterium]